jgi:hypothetical protein
MAPPLLAEEEGAPTEKELNLGTIHTSLSHYGRRKQVGFHHLSARPTSLPNPGQARASSCSIHELPVSHKSYQALRSQEAVTFTAWHDRTCPLAPHASGSMYLSVGIHPITARYSNSTKGTRIISMITLTPDKHALVKASFSIEDSVS